MAFEQQGSATRGFIVAGADLSAAQYHAVVLNGSGAAILHTTVAGRTYAVLQNAPAATRACTLWRDGVTKMVAGAAIVAGSPVALDATGRAVTAVATNHIIGWCVKGAGAANEICSVDLGYAGIL